jgi:hypothetical protein
MKFTKDYPNKEGWYWIKRATDRSWDGFDNLMYLEFYEDGFNVYPPGFYFIKDDFPVKLKSDVDWRFAGPLEPPVE